MRNTLNPLSRPTRARLGKSIRRAIEDDAVTSIVLRSGINVNVGADIRCVVHHRSVIPPSVGTLTRYDIPVV